MKTLSLKLKDDIFQEVERVIHILERPRNTYINDALEFYNMCNRRRLLKRKLYKESALVREISLNTLKEMEQLVDGLED